MKWAQVGGLCGRGGADGKAEGMGAGAAYAVDLGEGSPEGLLRRERGAEEAGHCLREA